MTKIVAYHCQLTNCVLNALFQLEPDQVLTKNVQSSSSFITTCV
jgi:hypothetical protein